MVQNQMNRYRGLKSASVLPYKPSLKSRPSPNPTSPLPPSPPKPRRKGIWIASGIFVYALTSYTFVQYTSLTSTPSSPLPTQDTDVSSRYDSTAPHFDQDVSWIETTSCIASLRRRLTEQAKGHVLEASVGTGRNGQHYDLEKMKSITFVDQSGPMVEIARQKWKLLHPNYEPCSFHTQSAMDPLPTEIMPKEGFTTVLQTMGVCSTPEPAATLAHLGTLTDPVEGRILLLEHGRSEWGFVNWILDQSAARHADRHGCWSNRDVGMILEESGLVIEKLERSQFGTLWYVEARPKPGSRMMDHQITEVEGKETSEERGWLGRLNPWAERPNRRTGRPVEEEAEKGPGTHDQESLGKRA